MADDANGAGFLEQVFTTKFIVAALAVPLFLSIKVLFIAKGNVSTALALFEHADVTQLIVGVALTNIPSFAAVVFVVASWVLIRSLMAGSTRLVSAALSAPLIILAAMLFPLDFGDTPAIATSVSGLLLALGTIGIGGSVLWKRRDSDQARKLEALSEVGNEYMSLPVVRTALAIGNLDDAHVELVRETASLASGVGGVPAKRYYATAPEAISGVEGTLDKVGDKITELKEAADDNAIRLEQLDMFAAQEVELRRKAEALEDTGVRKYVGLLSKLMGLSFSLVVGIILLVFTSDSTWLPAERVTIGDGKPFVGYVVDEGDGTVLVLVDSNRSLVRLPSDNTSYEICQVGSGFAEDSFLSNVVEPNSDEGSEEPRNPNC